MTKNEKTSPRVATKASQVLRSSSANSAAKSVAASALSQAGTNKTTSAKVAATAAKTLDSSKASQTVKTIAGSVLTQKTKR